MFDRFLLSSRTPASTDPSHRYIRGITYHLVWAEQHYLFRMSFLVVFVVCSVEMETEQQHYRNNCEIRAAASPRPSPARCHSQDMTSTDNTISHPQYASTNTHTRDTTNTPARKLDQQQLTCIILSTMQEKDLKWLMLVFNTEGNWTFHIL